MRLAPQEIRTFFVTTCTWQRRPLFRSDPLAHLFLDTLHRYRHQGRFRLHAYVLMPDHFHALLTPLPDISLEKAMQLIKGGFSFRVKREMNSNLEIWQAGFTVHRVHDDDDFQKHSSYIRENPVRARIVETPAEYPYSSAVVGANIDPQPPWLKPQLEEVVISPG
jgi:putative transposase